jgi:DNA polymerase-3 subunit epsilon
MKSVFVFVHFVLCPLYNSNKFDLPLLAEEFLRVDIDFDLKKRKFIDVQVIFHKMEQRTLSAAYKFYCDKDLENAHSAEADTRATYEVLKSQLERYANLENDVDKLSEFSAQNRCVDFVGRIVLNEKGVETFNFGKYKGVPVEEVFEKDPAYYGWMMNNEFPLYTKKVLTAIKLRGFNKKKK